MTEIISRGAAMSTIDLRINGVVNVGLTLRAVLAAIVFEG